MPSETGDDNAPGQDAEPSEKTGPDAEMEVRTTAEDVIDKTTNRSSTDKPKKPTKGTEPFERWERDEMEKMLGDLSGHLGKYIVARGRLLFIFPQSYSQTGFWRERMLRITFYSMLTGKPVQDLIKTLGQ